MTLFRVTAAAGVLIPLLTMSALAQTAPPDRRAVQPQQPQSLQQEIDSAVASNARTVTGLANMLAGYANQADALRQQNAELTQQLGAAKSGLDARDKTIADLTKERDDLKGKASPAAEPPKP